MAAGTDGTNASQPEKRPPRRRARKAERASMQRAEERADVSVTSEKIGDVRVSKTVEERPTSVEVPRERTRVDTSRRAADRSAEDGITSYEEGDTLVIPVVEERLEVRRVPWVVEEIVIRRTKIEETVPVTATLRKEVVSIDTAGDLETEDGRAEP